MATWDSLYKLLKTAFVQRTKRLPTVKEMDNLANKADEIFGEGFAKHGGKVQKMSEANLIQDYVGGVTPTAKVQAFPSPDPRMAEQSLATKYKAENTLARNRLQESKEANQRAAGIESLLGREEKAAGGRMGFSNGELASAKDFIESTGDDELMDLYIDFLDTGIDTKLIEALQRKGYQTYADGGKVRRLDLAGGGAAKKLLEKLSRQSKSPFGKMAIKESGGALPKGVEPGSLMGDILEGVNRIEDLIGDTKSLPQSRSEIADFVMNMRQDGFSNDAIVDIVKNYGDTYRLKTLREKIAPQVKIASDLGANTNAQRNFIIEMENTKDIYTPSEFRDTLKEGDLKYMVSDAMEKDFMAKGLSEDDAVDLASTIRANPENIFEGFDKIRTKAFYDYDLEVDDIVDFYEDAYRDYILPQTKQYKNKYEAGGIVSIIKKLAPKKSKKFPGEKTIEQLNKKIKDKKELEYSVQGKGLDIYERVGRDQTKRDRTAKAVKEYRKDKDEKKLIEKVKDINTDLIKQRKENYQGLPEPKKRKTLRLKKAEGGLSYLQGF